MTIPNSVTSIGSYAFSGCSSLTGSLTVSNSVTSIGSCAFFGCSGFDGTLTLPNSITIIKGGTFSGCSGLTGSLTIPNSVKTIEGNAFYRCSGFNGNLTISNSVTKIGQSAFNMCSGFTGTLNLPNTITQIEDFAFRSCESLTGSLIIPNSVKIIGYGAFEGCDGFNEKLIIPNSVTSIGEHAFYECTGIDFVKSEIEIPFEIDNSVFNAHSTTIQKSTLQVPTGTKTKYMELTGWTKCFKSVVEEGEPIVTTYSFTITASGNGIATFNNNKLRGKTQVFYVEEGTSAIVAFSPDAGYRIASVIVNDLDVTSSIVNNRYTISNILANTTLAVSFEAIPPTTYTFSITASGNGSAYYNNTIVRNKTEVFTINEGTSATITFAPDDGYRIASVKQDDTDVTASVVSNKYTISNITANTTLSVEFEAIPPTTYTLSISATGNGSATYDETEVRGKTQAFTVNEGTSATVTFTPDAGYRIASVKVNGTDVTSNVVSNKYTISSITANTTLEVMFESITHTLSITASDNGSATYNGAAIRGKTTSFTVNEGASATVTFTPDTGYRIKSIKLNDTDVTSSVANSQYTISNIKSDNTLVVEFEAIPPTTYTLSISATGNGSATYNSTVVKGKTQTFTVNEGTSATVTFAPDAGYQIASVKMNGIDVTSSVVSNKYTISSISANTTLAVTFDTAGVFTVTTPQGLAMQFRITDVEAKTVEVYGNYGTDETGPSVDPATEGCVIIPNEVEGYTVTGISSWAFRNCQKITSVVIPNGVIYIGASAFRTCYALEEINIPEGVTRIEDRAFYGINVQNLTLPSTLQSLGEDYVFRFNNDVENPIVTVAIRVPITIGEWTFHNSSNITLRVPEGCKAVYEAANYWNQFKTIEEYSTTQSFSYTVNEVCDGNILRSTSGQGKEGEEIMIPYRRYNVLNENLYLYEPSGGPKSLEYKHYFTLSADKQTETLNYDKQETAGPVVFLKEAEDIVGMTPCTIQNANLRSSNAAAAYPPNGNVEVTRLPAGVYCLTVIMFNSYVSPDEHWKFIAGTQEICDFHNTIVNFEEQTSDEFTITEETPIYLAQGGNDRYGVDLIYIVKVREYVPPVPNYSLNIVASGNGSVTYDGIEIRSKSSSFTVMEGTSATVTFAPDAGYQIVSVKLNGIDVTSSVVSNKYTISSISANTTLAVTFEAIPPTTYTFSITASDNGTATYNGTEVKGKTQSFTVNEGTSASVTFTPDAGYQIASVKLNDADVTSSIVNNEYTISNITGNTTLVVTFEAIPPTTYAFSVTSSGNGSAYYNNTTVRNKTEVFTVNEGTSATVTFTPDAGYQIASVKLYDTDVTSSVVSNKYTISNITANTTLSVTFEAIPPTTYTFSITASGKGTATYNGTEVKGKTQSFTVNEGTSATVTFAPDAGYRIASVKLNGTDVTSSVANGRYTISNIKSDNTLKVEFEAIPPSTYMLNIVAVGNGSVSYNNTTIRNQSKEFTVVEESNVTITISPDNGYRLASVIVNDVDVTANVSNNHYTISNISEATNIEVKFEAITHIMDIIAKGNGTAIYSGTTIRDNNDSFTITEGSSASIRFTPDAGHKIKSVLLNDVNVTSDVINNVYTISNITRNNILEVEFEAIMHTLTIKATGNGSVSYNDISFSNQSKSFKLKEGVSTVISITPDSGYRIKSVTVNSTDMTSQVTNGQITISNIAQDTNVEVTFEEMTYSLTITAAGNGAVTYDGQSVRGGSSTFTVVEGSYATVQISADDGYRLKRVMLDGKDVTADVTNGQYTTTKIMADMTLAVEFEEAFTELAYNGVNYKVVSYDEQKVNVASGNYGLTLTVPATFEANGKTWTVAGIDKGALANATELAAIIWNPEVALTAEVSNPNLLLYVKKAEFAPTTIQNVVVGSQAESIVLVEAAEGNNFYCPRAFTAQRISYSHNYSMRTGYKTCQGWETIVLPFDVMMITNAKGTELVPYVAWQDGSSQRPFWLYQLTSEGWQASNAIKANIPYIISMPNNELYHSSYNQSGYIEFVGNNVQVATSDQATTGQHGNKRLVANYQVQEASSSILALNVSNEWHQNTATEVEGSAFIRSLRTVHPFEAYMTLEGSAAGQRAIPVFDNDVPTDIVNVRWLMEDGRGDEWYTIDGRKLQGEPKQNGIYIYKGKKVKK